MKYIVRVERDSKTGHIIVMPPVSAPDGVEGYTYRRGQRYTRKALFVYDTMEEAMQAYANEVREVQFEQVPMEEWREIADKALADWVEKTQIPKVILTRWGLLNGNNNHPGRMNSPRQICRIMIATEIMEEALKKIKAILPGDSVTGMASMRRAGRPDIGKIMHERWEKIHAERALAQQQEQQEDSPQP